MKITELCISYTERMINPFDGGLFDKPNIIQKESYKKGLNRETVLEIDAFGV